MKAAVLEQLNKPLNVYDEIKLPDRLEYGQVLVEVKSSSICGAQIGEITGAKGEDKFLPHLLGHEGSGIVLKVGDGVRKVKVGDHVVLHWRKGSGCESNFPKYKLGDRVIGGGMVTTFNDYAIISENRLTTISKDVPFEIAALMGCAVTTALGLINNEARLKIGQSILVLGCGGVGLNIIQGAIMVSANPIIAVDVNMDKLAAATLLGATHIVHIDNYKDIGQQFKGIDVVVDCTGNSKVIEQGWKVARERMILVGQPHYKDVYEFSDARDTFYTGKIMMDSCGGQTNPDKDIPRYLDLYLNGKLNLEYLISHRFPLERINEAIDAIRLGETRKCILTF